VLLLDLSVRVFFDNLIFSQRFQSVSFYSTLQLESESITGLYSKVIARDYEATDMVGRNAGFEISSEYNVAIAYDTYGRINSRTAFGNTFSYSYLANSDLQSSISSGDVNMNWAYETNRNLVTAVQNKYSTNTVSGYAYTYDALGRRNEVVHSGSAFTQSNFNKWLYNDRSELIDGKKYLGTDPSDLSNLVTSYDYGFNYDNIGNRQTSTSSESSTFYTSNSLNQYTAVNTETPTYDDDGNMLTNSGWTYEWDADNRLKKAESGTTILEFKYDYMSRRVEKKLTQNGTVTKHERFVYDNYKCIERLDILDGGTASQKYVWCEDELLCMSDANGTYAYFSDANKNVGQLVNISTGTISAKYEYSPYGKLTLSNDTLSNPFKFSSEYYDGETSLVYYNYRYYSPILGRWLSRDPIEEKGGWNLYGMVRNNSISYVDSKGYVAIVDDAAAGIAVVVIVAGVLLYPIVRKIVEDIVDVIPVPTNDTDTKDEPIPIPRVDDNLRGGFWLCWARCNVHETPYTDPTTKKKCPPSKKCPPNTEGTGVAKIKSQAIVRAKRNAQMAIAGQLGCRTRHCHSLGCSRL